jgi:hypothetical protein
VKTGEGNKVDSELTEIRVQLTGKAEACRDTGHGRGHEMVKVTICGGGELEGAEADIVESFVINAERLIGVFNKLVNRERGVVRLNNRVGHLGRWHNREGRHDTVGIFLTNLGDEKGTHTGTRTTTERVCELEALEAVTRLSLLADDIEDRVYELSTLSVVTLGPIVTGTALTEDKVVGAEELTEGTSADRVHRTGFEIDEDGTGHVLATGGFVVVHIDALELEVRVTVVGSGGVNAVLLGDNLPELGTDLVTALAGLEMNDFTHDYW